MQSSEASSVKKSWFLVYTLFRTSWYNRYDWGTKDFQHLICRTAVHSQCLNCRNLILGLCLAQLISHYQKLLELHGAFLSLWKTFKYSFMKQVIFLEAQEAFNLKPLKVLKVCTAIWLTYGESFIRIISRYEPFIDTLDAVFFERGDSEEKGVRSASWTKFAADVTTSGQSFKFNQYIFTVSLNEHSGLCLDHHKI